MHKPWLDQYVRRGARFGRMLDVGKSIHLGKIGLCIIDYFNASLVIDENLTRSGNINFMGKASS
jgi:hypothetical protein